MESTQTRALNPIKSSTRNVLLVRVTDPLAFLRPAQDILISYEARIVRVMLGFLSIPIAGDAGSYVISLKGKTGGLNPVAIAWGCVGWQSMILIGTTMISGLQGRFTNSSKLQALTIGILVTFWINIFRLTIIYYLYYHVGQERALMFHDYGSIVMTIGWLFIYWWYSFNFVLEKQPANA